MRRRAKPAKAKVEAKQPLTRTSPKTENARVRDLERRLAEAVEREAEARKRESDAFEQQAATVHPVLLKSLVHRRRPK